MAIKPNEKLNDLVLPIVKRSSVSKGLELEAQRVLIWDYSKLPYGFLNNRVRYAIESATARYPIMAIKLAIV